NGTNHRAGIPQKSDVFVIDRAHNYRTVIVGKTNFCRRSKAPTVGRDVELVALGTAPRWGLIRASPQLRKSVAAARSTGLRPPLQQPRKPFGAVNSCRFHAIITKL